MGNCCGGNLEGEQNNIVIGHKSNRIVENARKNNNFHLILRVQTIMRTYLAMKKARMMKGGGIIDK